MTQAKCLENRGWTWVTWPQSRRTGSWSDVAKSVHLMPMSVHMKCFKFRGGSSIYGMGGSKSGVKRGEKASRSQHAKGVKREGMGKGTKLSPLPANWGVWEAGSGAEPRPKTGFGTFWAWKITRHTWLEKVSIFDTFVTHKIALV